MKCPWIIPVLLAVTACSTPPVPAATNTTVPTREPTATMTRTPTRTPVVETSTSTAVPRLPPEQWQEWPAIPEVISQRAVEIYENGLAMGNNPHAYSKIGGCLDTPGWFLGPYDGNPDLYSLGEYSYLQEVITTFQGSHDRTSIAAGIGYSSANVLTTFMADPKQCESKETPLACEVRLHQPSFAFVSLGSNDIYHQDKFADNMRQILDYLIEHGVVPILISKADNLEGDHAVNLEIARLAYEYDLPYWNFWLVVQPLPNHGLQEDGAHLTWAGPYFDDPLRMKAAWPWRNLTALQTLDAVWRGVTFVP